MWIWRMFLKSRPSLAAIEIRITLTFSPFAFALLVTYFISSLLFCEKSFSPVIMTYLATEPLLPLVLGRIVIASMGSFLCFNNPLE